MSAPLNAVSGVLEGKAIIVTGAGSGIGRAHSLEIAGQGAVVVVNDVSPRASDVVAEIREIGGMAVLDQTSVEDFEGMQSLVKQVVSEFGRLDGVVNNAGVVRDSTICNLGEDAWDMVLSVHLKGTFSLLKHACEHWRALAKSGKPANGRVVNTTSGTGLFGNFGQANYGAAKAAIANLTVIAAMEMERYGVTVNAISPIARTSMTEGLVVIGPLDPQEEWDEFDPSNSSPVVAWLLSDQSSWLSGTVLHVQGGTVARVLPWSVDESTQYSSQSGRRLEVAELDDALRVALQYGQESP